MKTACVFQLVLIGIAGLVEGFLTPSQVPQSLACHSRAAGVCTPPPQLRVKLNRCGVPLKAKRGGILEDNYVDPYVVLGVPKQVWNGFSESLPATVHGERNCLLKHASRFAGDVG